MPDMILLNLTNLAAALFYLDPRREEVLDSVTEVRGWFENIWLLAVIFSMVGGLKGKEALTRLAQSLDQYANEGERKDYYWTEALRQILDEAIQVAPSDVDLTQATSTNYLKYLHFARARKAWYDGPDWAQRYHDGYSGAFNSLPQPLPADESADIHSVDYYVQLLSQPRRSEVRKSENEGGEDISRIRRSLTQLRAVIEDELMEPVEGGSKIAHWAYISIIIFILGIDHLIESGVSFIGLALTGVGVLGSAWSIPKVISLLKKGSETRHHLILLAAFRIKLFERLGRLVDYQDKIEATDRLPSRLILRALEKADIKPSQALLETMERFNQTLTSQPLFYWDPQETLVRQVFAIHDELILDLTEYLEGNRRNRDLDIKITLNDLPVFHQVIRDFYKEKGGMARSEVRSEDPIDREWEEYRREEEKIREIEEEAQRILGRDFSIRYSGYTFDDSHEPRHSLSGLLGTLNLKSLIREYKKRFGDVTIPREIIRLGPDSFYKVRGLWPHFQVDERTDAEFWRFRPVRFSDERIPLTGFFFFYEESEAVFHEFEDDTGELHRIPADVPIWTLPNGVLAVNLAIVHLEFKWLEKAIITTLSSQYPTTRSEMRNEKSEMRGAANDFGFPSLRVSSATFLPA